MNFRRKISRRWEGSSEVGFEETVREVVKWTQDRVQRRYFVMMINLGVQHRIS
jgi:hypothetical protein